MTPIINPWIIYALGMCEGAKILLLIIGLCGGIAYIGIGLEPWAWEIRKSVVALLVLCCVAGFLIPSEDTAMQMLVAQNVTYERVEAVGQTVEDIYEDILDVIGDKEE